VSVLKTDTVSLIVWHLLNILSEKSGYSYDAVIQAVTNHLRTSQRISPMAKEKGISI
jgi:hypothetical protein